MQYVTDDDKQNEKRIAKQVCDKDDALGFVASPSSTCPVDGAITRDGVVKAFIEIKKRNIKQNQFSEILIDKKKVDRAWSAASELEIGFSLIFEFIDGTFVFQFDMNDEPSYKYPTKSGGRTKDVRDENDLVGMVYLLPSKEWKKL